MVSKPASGLGSSRLGFPLLPTPCPAPLETPSDAPGVLLERASLLFLVVAGTVSWRGQTASPFGLGVRVAYCLLVEKIERSRAQGGLGQLVAGSPLGGRVVRRSVSRGASRGAVVRWRPGNLSLTAGRCGVPAKGAIGEASASEKPVSPPSPISNRSPKLIPLGPAHSPHRRRHRSVLRPGFFGRPDPQLGWK